MPKGIYKRKPFTEEHKRKIGLSNAIAVKAYYERKKISAETEVPLPDPREVGYHVN